MFLGWQTGCQAREGAALNDQAKEQEACQP